MYPEELVKPMRQELVSAGFKELYTSNEVEEAGLHKTKYAIPYENNLTIFVGRGLKRTLEELRQSNKIFI